MNLVKLIRLAILTMRYYQPGYNISNAYLICEGENTLPIIAVTYKRNTNYGSDSQRG